MAFSESEVTRHLKTLEAEFWSHCRPPLHLREQIREGQRIDGLAMELFYERPAFERPGESAEDSIARLRYVRSRDAWWLFWMRADLKFHRYEPCPEVPTLSEALAVIREDTHCCFFG